MRGKEQITNTITCRKITREMVNPGLLYRGDPIYQVQIRTQQTCSVQISPHRACCMVRKGLTQRSWLTSRIASQQTTCSKWILKKQVFASSPPVGCLGQETRRQRSWSMQSSPRLSTWRWIRQRPPLTLRLPSRHLHNKADETHLNLNQIYHLVPCLRGLHFHLGKAQYTQSQSALWTDHQTRVCHCWH